MFKPKSADASANSYWVRGGLVWFPPRRMIFVLWEFANINGLPQSFNTMPLSFCPRYCEALHSIPFYVFLYLYWRIILNGSINGPFSSLWQTVFICLTIVHSHNLTHLKRIKDRLTCKILQRDDSVSNFNRHYLTPLLLTVNKSWRAIFPAFFNQVVHFLPSWTIILPRSLDGNLVSFSFGSIGATINNAKTRLSDSTRLLHLSKQVWRITSCRPFVFRAKLRQRIDVKCKQTIGHW